MEKYGIVIDSTVYLSQQLIKDNNIHVVSLNVTIDGESFYETELTRETIIQKRKEGSKFLTSAPSPGEFSTTYEKLLETVEHVFVIGLSKELSGTYQSSMVGRDMLDEPKNVTIFDTNSSAYGNELLVRLLLRLIKEDQTLKTIQDTMHQYIEHESLMFTCENLFSLVSGGRLSSTRAMIGTVLRVKPIIEMTDGKLLHMKSERTYGKVFNVIKEKIDQTTKPGAKLYFYITHTNSLRSGDMMVEFIESAYPDAEIMYTDLLGPVMTVHVGNKGFGIAWTYE